MGEREGGTGDGMTIEALEKDLSDSQKALRDLQTKNRRTMAIVALPFLRLVAAEIIKLTCLSDQAVDFSIPWKSGSHKFSFGARCNQEVLSELSERYRGTKEGLINWFSKVVEHRNSAAHPAYAELLEWIRESNELYSSYPKLKNSTPDQYAVIHGWQRFKTVLDWINKEKWAKAAIKEATGFHPDNLRF